MSIKSKPTGLSVESSIIYNILKQINRLTQVVANGSVSTTTTTTLP